MTARPLPLVFALLAAAASVCAPGVALASPDYPGVIQDHLTMPCPPPCTLCHSSSSGGVGTVSKPFGKTLKDGYGLTRRDADLLRSKLDEMEQPVVVDAGADAGGVTEYPPEDSDQDGVPDIAELRQARDPNEKGSGVLCATYGCGARVAPDTQTDGAGLLVALGVAAALVVSRRRAR